MDRLNDRPNFDRDAKEILGGTRERLEKAIKDSTVKNEEAAQKIADTFKQDVFPVDSRPEDIESTKDFLLMISDLASDYIAIDDRSTKLLENLSQFKFDAPDYLLPQIASIKYARPNMAIDDIKKQFPNAATIDANFLDCIVKLLMGPVQDFYGVANGAMMEPNELKKYAEKYFPKFGTLFLVKLFVLFIKGFLWTLFSDLCKQFYKFRIKIGPFKVRPLRPLCSMLRSWVLILNKGSDWSVNPDRPNSEVSYGTPSSGKVEKTKWRDCPHSFYMGTLTDEANLVAEYRAIDDNTAVGSDPCSVCAGGNPTPDERQAAIDIAKYIVNNGITGGTGDGALAADYLAEKTRNISLGESISTSFKKMVEYDNSTGDEEAVKAKHDRGALQDIANLRAAIEKNGDLSAAADQFGNSIGADEFTKGVLTVNAALLKAWDTTISAVNDIYTVSRMNKDLICCFITAISLILTSSMSASELKSTKMDMAKAKKTVISVLKFLRTVLDTETDWLASDAEINYLTGAQLLGSVQDAMIKTVIIFLTPLVDEASKEVNKYLNPVEMEKKLNEAIKESITSNADDLKKVYQLKQYYAIIQKCVPFRYLLGLANCMFAKLKNWLMNWLLGFKSQNDNTAASFTIQVKASAQAKAFFMLRAILDKMTISFEQEFEQLWTMCDEYGDVKIVGDDLVDALIAEANETYGTPNLDKNAKDDGKAKYWNDIGEPVMATRKTNIVPGDLYDTMYTDTEWPIPSTKTMAGYQTPAEGDYTGSVTAKNKKADAVTDDVAALFRSAEQQPVEPTLDDNTKRARECRDTTFITSIFNELREYHNMTK